MPDKPEPRLLTEDEHTAILGATIQRETAALQDKVTALETEKAELQTKLDTSAAALETEKQARETAEKALEDYKAQVEREREIAARKDERVAKVREVASHLKDDFFTPERVQGWAEMEQAAFDAWVAEVAALTSGVAPAAKDGQPPRETAMQGRTPQTPVSTGNAARLFQGKIIARKEG